MAKISKAREELVRRKARLTPEQKALLKREKAKQNSGVGGFVRSIFGRPKYFNEKRQLNYLDKLAAEQQIVKDELGVGKPGGPTELPSTTAEGKGQFESFKTAEGDTLYRLAELEKDQQDLVKKRALEGGLQELEALKGLEDLNKPTSEYDKLLESLGATTASGGGVSDYLPLIGQAAGTYFGGPLGGAAGQVLGQLGGSLWDQGGFSPYENAARINFERNTIPAISERFAGTGSMGSSAFQNALAQGGVDLETDLAVARANYDMQRRQENMQRRQLASEIQGKRFGENLANRELMNNYLTNRYNMANRNVIAGLAPRFSQSLVSKSGNPLAQFASGLAPLLGASLNPAVKLGLGIYDRYAARNNPQNSTR